MKNKRVKRKYITVFFALLLLVIAFIGGRGISPAFADTAGYTNVLTDLQKDSKFNVGDYSDNIDDFENKSDYYSIQVIQIAESTDGELFIYTYQPCQKTTYLIATRINMSLTDKMGSFGVVIDTLVGIDQPELYNLTLLSCNGVFCKYRVNDFVLSSDAVRYYNIATICREYNPDYGDTGSSSESIIKEKAFNVGKLYIATTENGRVQYRVQEKKTIEILNPFFAYLEYNDGFKLCPTRCHSHYIAFDTDLQVDFLQEVTVSYVSTECSRATGLGLDGSTTKNEPVFHPNEIVKFSDSGENSADGWFGKKYTWDRIEKTEDFIKKEDINDDYKNHLKNTKWVVRFCETSTSLVVGQYSNVYYWTEISEVTILRLRFVTAGITYDLGAVSDIGHNNGKPSNNNTNEFANFGEWLERLTGIPAWFWWLLSAIIPLLILLPILGAIFPVFGQFLVLLIKVVGKCLLWLFKSLWWLICLPFKGIAKLMEYIKDKKGGG